MFEFWEDGDRQVTVLRQAEAAAAQAFLAQTDALLAVWDSSPADARTGRRPHALAEAGLALGLHPQTVEHRLSIALGLRDHPVLRRLLCEARLAVPHLLTALDVVGELGDPVLADRVLEQVLLREGRLGWPGTPGELRTALTRAAVRLDPAGAARRRGEAQEARTQVRLRARDNGLAHWTATGPAPSLIAADRLLDVLSRPAGPDDSRSRGQRQLDALLGALLQRAGSAVPLELELEIPTRTTAVEIVGPVDVPEPLKVRAELTSELLALLTTDPQTSAVQPGVPEPEIALRRHLDEAEEGEEAGEAGEAGEADEALRPQARRRPRGGVPELVGHGPVDPCLLAELLTDPAGLPAGLGPVRVRRACTDQHGQVTALDDRARPLHQLLTDADPPRRHGAHPTTGSPAGRLLRALTDQLPAPPPRTDAHDPTAAQTRVLRARDPHCTWPGCPRPARRSDIDHRHPHPDGPTALGNLHPLCRHHHRLKHDGFRPTRHLDGSTTWTTPRGQRITTHPP